MLPKFPLANSGDCLRPNTIPLGKCLEFASAYGSRTDSSYIVFSQFGLPDCLSVGLTPFVNFIKIVIGTSAKEKVLRTDTSRSITAMTHGKTIRNWAIRLFIGKAMSAYRAPLTSHLEQAMPKVRFASCPKPAVRGFINLCPKNLCNVFAMPYVGALGRAIIANLGGLSRKSPATYPACACALVFEPLGIAKRGTKKLNLLCGVVP